MTALSQVDTWPVPNVSAATVAFDGRTTIAGDPTRPYELASLSKVITTWAVLVAVEEGIIRLDSPVGQPGCTLRHLLSHAGGYPFAGATPLAPPARRRIYSNTGIELAAEAVAVSAGIGFADYIDEAIFQPLGMHASVLRGSPAHAISSTVADLVTFVSEVIRPTLLDPATVTEATRAQFPELAGLVPGVGSFRPCPWGLGVEIHGSKHPHWMGATNSADTFGHFGGAGTMMWVDPAARVALVALTDRRFEDWAAAALQVWPAISDAVVAETLGTN